ncbi:galanin receptor 2a-like [Diadema antillarum]|uniref:galanin receptor 2a-like n=1 Tax=Diadema antillarum TaxID=105358 RepID=UPI003A890373
MAYFTSGSKFETSATISSTIAVIEDSPDIHPDGLNEANASMSTYLVTWSWQNISWSWWLIIQLIFAIVGIIGNFIVLLVLSQGRRHRCSTDTLIAGLAAADLITSVFIIPHSPINTLPDSILGQIFCRVIHSSVPMWTSISASVFTLTVITIERLVAIRHPFLYQRLFTAERSVVALVLVWVLSFIVNTFPLYVTFIDGGTCVVHFPTQALQKTVGITLFLLKFVVPVTVMMLAHVLTIRSLKIRKQNLTSGKEQEKHALKMLTARRRATKLLFTIIITFIICWTPDQVSFLALNVDLVHFNHLYSPLYRILVVLAFANSCVNPIIYASRSPNFRRAIKELCCLGRSVGLQSVFGGIEDIRVSTHTVVSAVSSKEIM